jgi:glycosyltransferase involved in cell wall biosynthesis
VLHYLRMWDRQSADRPDVLVANSQYVARRIAKTYRRPARVIYPPVDVERFRADQPREDFYFTVSRMVSYKRIDLLVQAATKLGRQLVVVGDGPEMARVRSLAGPTVHLLGEQSDAVVTDHLQRCKAFLFAAREDFGISPVEAMAAGAPVLCLGRGGTRETVRDGVTGLYYEVQEVDALVDAIQRFERDPQRFEPQRIRAHAETFSETRFRQEMQDLIAESLEQFRGGKPFA